MFEIKNVSKQFGDEFALRDITMNITSGLNFIIGSSGSGKTTLLKIISGMEQDFKGEALYCGQSIKALEEADKSYFYNSVFGFVWQAFNLIDDMTVLENVTLPQYLKQGQDKKAVMKILRELKISELAGQKVAKLSGGQKQRVAIARELVKNPQVIIADEPTSALDEASAKMTMDILRDISKTRTVIVVTHDTSLIDGKSKVYELDKGELIASAEPKLKNASGLQGKKLHKLTLLNGCRLACHSIKSKLSRFAVTAISLLVAATLLLVTVSGSVENSSAEAFNKLFETYGDSILDISIVASFTGAGGTDGKESDKPNTDVTQNIEGLYDKYRVDSRVEHIVFTQAFNEIKIKVDGKDYSIQRSGSIPTVNKLTAGVMPMGDGYEAVVPISFIKMMGLSEKQALGKTIELIASVYNWDSGEPVLVPVKTTVKIVGVVDTTVRYETENGEIQEYTVDDAFFFSKSALYDMRAQAGIEKSDSSFSIRTKSPAEMIAIKDELNAMGIVPLGRFELVEDMVRLNTQTTQQSGSAVIIIGLLSFVAVLSVAAMTGFTRKKEYAIYKVSGYSKRHLVLLTAGEALVAAVSGGILFLCASPLLNMATTAIWSTNILSGKLLFTGVLLVIAMGAFACTVTSLIACAVKPSASLKAGDI